MPAVYAAHLLRMRDQDPQPGRAPRPPQRGRRPRGDRRTARASRTWRRLLRR